MSLSEVSNICLRVCVCLCVWGTGSRNSHCLLIHHAVHCLDRCVAYENIKVLSHQKTLSVTVVTSPFSRETCMLFSISSDALISGHDSRLSFRSAQLDEFLYGKKDKNIRLLRDPPAYIISIVWFWFHPPSFQTNQTWRHMWRTWSNYRLWFTSRGPPTVVHFINKVFVISLICNSMRCVSESEPVCLWAKFKFPVI